MAIKDVKAIDIFKETGIAESTISKIANNKTDSISFETMKKLTNYLNCTYDELLDTTRKFDSREDRSVKGCKELDNESNVYYIRDSNQKIRGTLKLENMICGSQKLTDYRITLIDPIETNK